MKPIQKDEMFAHVSQFLKGKGIELKEGSYVAGVQKSCGILTDAINLSQQGLERARGELNKRMEQVRQVIHEKTAPRSKPAAAGSKGTNQKSAARKAKPGKANRGKSKG